MMYLSNAVVALTGGVYGDSPSAEFLALLDFRAGLLYCCFVVDD